MKIFYEKIILTTLFSALVMISGAFSQTSTYTITVDESSHGSVSLNPALPADGKYAEGTVVTVTATPQSGYAVDAVYYSTQGQWGAMFYDTPRVSSIEVTVNEDKNVGAYFIEQSLLDGFTVTSDVVFAQPGVKPLKYDVYSPDGADNLPIIIIIHGGGWTSNDEDIMRGMARQLAQGGKYVVASIDYRWRGQLDGDEQPNTMLNLIEDVFGGIAHIMEHAGEYGGDASRILLTGDSAGGHLSAAAATMPHMIGDGGFGESDGVYEYLPTYLPENKSADQVRSEMMSAIKGVAPSYGVFEFNMPNVRQMLGLVDAPAAAIEAISPLSNIPNASDRPVPHYLTRGTQDPLISDENVTKYMDALIQKGQRVEYVQVGGAGHAFFDWKPNDSTVETYNKYGVYYVDDMELFFDSVLSE
ncbi:alpha/beta hydrolase fold domain-containing protein [Rhodohalobacter sp. 614A]|uniref:alpha/beta hydrolase fold domain-containing protein n=1 Tax=Rhodohalobacter sp. 614A TaxID=2908649 RepID=UPI001F32C856|nr:alpha/beta hydrolase fold domain-containing protein [Rhodohalobacter sp. 614A]